MTMQGTATPAAPAAPTGSKFSTENLLDGFEGDLEMEDPSDEPRPERKGQSDLKPEDFDEVANEGEEEEEKPKPKAKPKTAATPKGEAGDEGEEEAETAAKALPKDRGTQDKPYSVKDLPDDKFVQVKIDGKPATVSMKELASGYIRMETFHAAHGRANDAIEEATQMATRSLGERKALRDDLQHLFRTPDRLFKHMLNNNPREMLELGKQIAMQFKAWNDDPNALAQHEHALQLRQVEGERQRLQQERQQWEQQQRSTQAAAEAQKVWAPAYEKVMKEAGFPKLTPDFKEDCEALLRQAKSKAPDGKLSSEVFEGVFRRVLKMHKLESVGSRQPGAPTNPPRQLAATTPRGKKDFSKMSPFERMRDPDYFLQK